MRKERKWKERRKETERKSRMVDRKIDVGLWRRRTRGRGREEGQKRVRKGKKY